MDSAIAKFTRVLPLSIRKDSSAVNHSGGSLAHLQNTEPSSNNHVDLGFFREPVTSPAMDMFKDAYEKSNANSNSRNWMEQKELVRVTMTYPSPSVGAMNAHKEISLRLTNDENPMFFYHLRITEADYPVIKSQQGLLVDFFGFPNQLVMLLEKCDPNSQIDIDENTKCPTSAGPKFVLVMKIGMQSVLDIVESNPFKYLCHLSLHINPGTDTEVKKYLADVTTGMKKECSLWQEKYSHLTSAMEGEMTRLKTLLEKKNQEINELREEIHTQTSSLSTKHFEDMTFEKEKLLKMQSDLASKFEIERQEMDKRQAQAINVLEQKLSSVDSENRDLLQYKYKTETALQENRTKVKNLEGDLNLLQKETTLSRKQNEKLDTDYHEKQRMVNSLQNRISVIEADLREKQNTLQRQEDYIAQISEQKRFLENHVSSVVKEVEKLKTVNKNVSAELIKANEIIRKLQDDIRSLHTKTKLQSQITLEQERIINDRDKQIQNLEGTILKTNAILSSFEETEEQRKVELEESKGKIESLQDTVKSNENMISWLNKQLNEFQGLGNLAKFRQNLGSASAAPLSRANVQDSLANNSVAALNGSSHSGRLFSSNFQNTLPNGTPSWMHIYQSTSTPLETDLSSRFERVSANNNNYTLGRSRLDTISEKTGDTNIPEKYNPVPNEVENLNPGDFKTQASMEKNAAVGRKSTKPPTWAKPRSGKVTLEFGAPSKSNPAWRK